MFCADVRARLLASDDAAGPDIAEHVARCPVCAGAETALGRLDRALRAGLVAEPPPALRARLAAACARAPELRADSLLRRAVVIDPPPSVQERLAFLPAEAAAGRIDRAVREAVIVEPPAALRARLAALVSLKQAAAGGPVGLWREVWARLDTAVGQAVLLAVLALALYQAVAWLNSARLVLGDIPYALELLAASPAIDYLEQLDNLIQQFGLWLLVAAAGWLMARNPFWRGQRDER